MTIHTPTRGHRGYGDPKPGACRVGWNSRTTFLHLSGIFYGVRSSPSLGGKNPYGVPRARVGGEFSTDAIRSAGVA